jgi:thioredoxin 1
MTEKNFPSSFDELLKTHPKPILVDFWAEWCGPCRMVSPVLEELAKEWKDRVTVIKINTDHKQQLAAQYNISGIPCIILFKNGKEVERIVGALPKPAIKSKIEPHLK